MKIVDANMSIFIEESLDETKKEYGFLAVEILSNFEDEFKNRILSSGLNRRITNYLSDMDYDYSGLDWDDLTSTTDLTDEQVEELGKLQTLEEFIKKCKEFLNQDKIDSRLVDSFAYNLASTIQLNYYKQLEELNNSYKHTIVKTVPPRIIFNLYSDSYFYESSRCW